jgi:hypothetical protein
MTEKRMAHLRDIFESFERRTVEVLKPDKELFLPGIDRDGLKQRLSGLPLAPPESLLRRRNGVICAACQCSSSTS